jgi:hypothetical protein
MMIVPRGVLLFAAHAGRMAVSSERNSRKKPAAQHVPM